jgi:hypothetical protein
MARSPNPKEQTGEASIFDAVRVPRGFPSGRSTEQQ